MVSEERWGSGGEAAVWRTLAGTMWRPGPGLGRPTSLDGGSSRRITIMRALLICGWVTREYQCDSPSRFASLPESQRCTRHQRHTQGQPQNLDRLVHISSPPAASTRHPPGQPKTVSAVPALLVFRRKNVLAAPLCNPTVSVPFPSSRPPVCPPRSRPAHTKSAESPR